MRPFKKVDAQDIAMLRTFVPAERFFVEDEIHPDYAHDEMKRGSYLREYKALNAYLAMKE